jgi:glycosyltransferase involved in cell wall biosynthesis
MRPSTYAPNTGVGLGLPADTRLMIFVGRLDRQKDPLLLLDAFARSAASDPGLHLVVVGDGALRGEVEAGIATRGIAKRVTLLGALGAARIAGWLRAADLFVLSSAYEGMPIAVLEALACGFPVASTDVGEIRRVVRDGITGRIAKRARCRRPQRRAAPVAGRCRVHGASARLRRRDPALSPGDRARDALRQPPSPGQRRSRRER